MQYFAFIRRDERGRYLARFPDLPGVIVRADSLRQLQQRLAPAARGYLDAHPYALAPAVRATSLPRMDDDLDGYWLEVDV